MSVSNNSIISDFSQLTEAVEARDAESLVDALKYGSPLLRHASIVYLIAKDWHDESFTEPIKSLREDYSPVMFELPLNLYAYAYLDKYGVEKYEGDLGPIVKDISSIRE